ncbi:MAG TPA: DUF6600 domain-containing protein [Candidatus Binatia bacterium]|nr:DUF6600 domain-containing protein [Candidatus Binatia bacterium]
MTRTKATVITALVILFSGRAWANDEPPPVNAMGRTPARLSFLDGEVSFWRPGAKDWTPARVNIALAAGDALYTGHGANLELQIGARAFVRAGQDTQLGLENQEPDFVQFKVTAGHASLDLRGLAAGHTVEIDTPNAAFTIERVGYYRINVDDAGTTFITRRGGRATMTPAGGEAVGINPSEQLVIEGTETARVESYVAPELDDWDRWNYDRTDHLIDTVSSRYVAPGVYGIDALDHYGNWRIVPSYGSVWIPDGVAAGWVPYSTGRWMWDPFFGWTWVDDAPWGWAPFHYGRWVYVDSYWAWAPGPVVRPVYAPALVAFFGGGGFAVHIGLGVPAVGWVALGWGEPLVPWWGPVGFVGRPCWHGWGGPRIVNNVVIEHTTIVNVNDIHNYRNVGVHNSVIAISRNRFGQSVIQPSALTKIDAHGLEPIRGALPVKPVAASLAPAEGRGQRPPEDVLHRGVVATRPPRQSAPALPSGVQKPMPALTAPAPRIVSPPPRAAVPARPPLGHQGDIERSRPPEAPRFERPPEVSPPGRVEPRAPVPPMSGGQPQPPPPPQYRSAPRELPGEPANRLPPPRARSVQPAEPRAQAQHPKPRAGAPRAAGPPNR